MLNLAAASCYFISLVGGLCCNVSRLLRMCWSRTFAWKYFGWIFWQISFMFGFCFCKFVNLTEACVSFCRKNQLCDMFENWIRPRNGKQKRNQPKPKNRGHARTQKGIDTRITRVFFRPTPLGSARSFNTLDCTLHVG